MSFSLPFDYQISFNEYITIFNYLSRLIYFSTNDDIREASLSLRRYKHNELLSNYEFLDSIKDRLTEYGDNKFKYRFTNLYNFKINDRLAISVIDCSVKCDDDKDYYIYPFTYSNINAVFSDDIMHIMLFIDEKFYSSIDYNTDECAIGIKINSQAEYFYKMLSVISDNFSVNGIIDKYDLLLANVLFKDSNLTDKKINKFIDKMLKNGCADSTPYIRIVADVETRQILDEYSTTLQQQIDFPGFSLQL